MTQLTDNLIAVLVPDKYPKYWIHWDGVEQVTKLTNDGGWRHFQQRLDGNPKEYNIVGIVSKSGEFDFDCEKYVESTNDNPLNASYFNYEIGLFNKNNLEFCKEESFISLLNSKGIFLEKLEGQKILILEKL